MADHQRVHPETVIAVNDPEAQQKQTVPLVPRGSSRSESGEPREHYPPFQRTLPAGYSKPPKRRSCCGRCLCWILCMLLVLVIIVGVLAAVIYFGFDPKIPKYSVDSIGITQFTLNNDNSLTAAFNVNITARNPNSKIGIYYRGGSALSVWYTNIKLCEGSFPKFYQGHRNTTLLSLILTGQNQDATGLFGSLQAQQQTGSIPLRLNVKVPVRIKLGKLTLPKWKFVVRCGLDVDSLAANNAIRIRDSSCKFRFRL